MASVMERFESVFESFAGKASRATGSFWAFVLADFTVNVWDHRAGVRLL